MTMIRALEEKLQKTVVGEFLNDLQMSGCSYFFITSSIMSILNAKRNKKISLENAEKDEDFQRELTKQKERYEDIKEAKDRAFKLWLKQKQRQWAAEETSRRIENDLLKADLQMFFDDWPLQLNIATINRKRKTEQNNVPLNIIVAKHAVEVKDPFSVLYPEIVDQVQTFLREMNLSCVDENSSKVCVYRFKDDKDLKVVGGPALANIYAMMSTFPSIVIQPKLDSRNKKIAITLACWNQDSLFPFQRKIMELDYDTSMIDFSKDYLDSKKRELICAYATIAIVFNDAYSLIENESDPLFPEFAKKHKIVERYPLLIEFARKEYSSLLYCNEIIENNKSQVNADDYLNDTLPEEARAKLKKTLEEF